MCSVNAMLVGVSSVPAVMAILSSPTGLQNILPPQTRQNPRSALSDDLYQFKPSDVVRVRLTEGTLVIAT